MLKNVKDRGPLLSESIIYLASNIATAGVPFILLPLLTEYLTPAQYGEVAMFQTMIGFFGAFIGLSCHQFVSRKHFDLVDVDEKASLNGACIQVVALSACMLFLVCYLFGGVLSGLFGLPKHFLYLGVLVCAATAVIQVRLACWQVSHDPKKYGLTQVAQALLNFILTVVMVMCLLMASDGRIYAQSLSVLVVFVCSICLFYSDKMLSVIAFVPHHVLGILKFGVPLIPHVLGVFLLVTIDRFVINSQLGLGQTGIYMVGVQIAVGLALFFDGLNKAFVPWLYENLKKENADIDRRVVKVVYCFLLCALAVGVSLSYGVPLLIPYVVDEQYHSVSEFIGWLLMGQVFSGMYLLFANFIFFSKRTGWLSILSISCGALNVALLLVLLESKGVEGAAIAFCIVMALRMLFTWCVSMFKHPMPWLG